MSLLPGGKITVCDPIWNVRRFRIHTHIVTPRTETVRSYNLTDMISVDTITQRREDWSSASVLNHTIATDPTIRQPGFHLPHHTYSLMNRFRTNQGPCHANLHKCGLALSPFCRPLIVASARPRTTLSTRAN